MKSRGGHVRNAIHTIKQKMGRYKNNISNQLDQTMMHMMVAAMDVAEVYSPPRMANMASNMGLRAGWSLDLNTKDTDGKALGFNAPEMRNRAARRVLEDKPMLLISNPMCTTYIM